VAGEVTSGREAVVLLAPAFVLHADSAVEDRILRGPARWF